jgi:serine/threonine-protein kinase
MEPTPGLEPYRLIDRFAVGGNAEIYRAHDTRNGDVVVIKRLRSDVDFEPEAVAGFILEGELGLRMRHRNLIRARGRGTFDGLDYIVLDYVDGPDLSRVLGRASERKVRIPTEFCLFIVREVLDGLDFAHDLATDRGWPMGLVHRDLSPRNVFIAYDGTIRLADFGSAVSTLLEPPPTEVIGSPGYLSPEQAALGPLDRRSDVFSVGCMLFHLMAGFPPYDVAGKREDQVLAAHRRGSMRPLPGSVPDAVRAIITRACALDRDQRHPTAAAMRDDVDRVLHEKAYTCPLAIATLTRHLFKAEYQSSRLSGSPLTF